MNDQTDAQLLRAYAEHRSDPAFAELVRRHVDIVHSAAVRMVCDSHLAQDVTQGVFLALARNAAQLTDRPVLSGWLHRTAQNIAAQTVRTDVRRHVREQEAAAMNELLAAEPDNLWEHIAPQLDTALGELNEADRDALLLRYFERKSASEMATTLGISDEAAQKRVSRAVERLREFFLKRGLTVGASGLAVVISANAVQAAPVGLAITISSAAALAGTTIVTAATVTATKTIAMTALQKTVVTATVAILAGAGIFEARQALLLRDENQLLQQQHAPLIEQIQQLERERDEATNRLALLRDDNERLSRNTTELLRLRSQTASLQKDFSESRSRENKNESDPIQLQVKSWASRVQKLIKSLDQMPDKVIPEYEFLSDTDWLDVVKDIDLETDDDIRMCAGFLRQRAEEKFSQKMRDALKKFVEANKGELPGEISQLKSYFNPPLSNDTDILKRYKLLHTGKLADMPDETGWLVAGVAAPIDKYDTHFPVISINAWSRRNRE